MALRVVINMSITAVPHLNVTQMEPGRFRADLVAVVDQADHAAAVDDLTGGVTGQQAFMCWFVMAPLNNPMSDILDFLQAEDLAVALSEAVFLQAVQF